jgi:hypothetical protein
VLLLLLLLLLLLRLLLPSHTSFCRLNEKQVIGLKYVKDFESRIPREEIQEIETVLLKVAHDLVSMTHIRSRSCFPRS